MLKKIAPIAGLAAVLVAGAGVATASTAAEPAKTYGVCVSSKGAVRVLEAKALSKSRYGKCKTGEKKLLVPSIDGVPKAINGKSAYQIWLAQTGNAGKTEAQFLESLKGGPKGDTGAAGKDGRGFDQAFKLVLDSQPARNCTWAAATSTLTCVTP